MKAGEKKQQERSSNPKYNKRKQNRHAHTHKTQLAGGITYCFANTGNPSIGVQGPRKTNSWAVTVDRYLEQWIWRQAAARHRGSTFSSPRAARWVTVDAPSLAFLFGEKHCAGKARLEDLVRFDDFEKLSTPV